MILQTVSGFSHEEFSEALFPLGTWCAVENLRPELTAADLPGTTDVNVSAAANEIVDVLEAQIYDVMNQIHNVRLSQRFWRHTLGTYFRVLVPQLVHRFNLIARVVAHTNCTSFTFADLDVDSWTPNTRNDLQVLVNSHGWNHIALSSLCEHFGLTPKAPREIRNFNLDIPLLQHEPTQHAIVKRSVQAICNAVSRKSTTMITQSLLPKSKEVQLSLLLRTLPFFWNERYPYDSSIDHQTRNSLSSAFNSPDSLQQTIGSLAIRNIPRLYVERFHQVRKSLSELLPEYPSAVFTSNLHMASEEFLLWLADAKEHGSKITIGQHGGVHCLAKVVPPEVNAEIDLADNYLAWGDFATQVDRGVRAPTLINFGRATHRRRRTSRKVDVAVILDSPYRYPSIPRGLSADRFDYANLLNSLLHHLDANESLRITLRLHSSHLRFGDALAPLINRKQNLIIDSGDGPIDDLYKVSRTIITTSIGTTFFQTLYLNRPTLMLIDPRFSSLSDWANGVLHPLVESSILFSDEQELSAHFVSEGSDLETWWTSSKVQSAREAFIKTFSSEPHQDLGVYVQTLSTRAQGLS